MPAMSRPNKSPKPSKARENSKPKAGTHAHAAAGVSPAATRGSQTSKDAKMAAGRGSNSQPADRGNRRATAGTAAAAAKGNNTMRCRLSVMARPLGDRISRAGPRAAPGQRPGPRFRRARAARDDTGTDGKMVRLGWAAPRPAKIL